MLLSKWIPDNHFSLITIEKFHKFQFLLYYFSGKKLLFLFTCDDCYLMNRAWITQKSSLPTE